MAKFPALPIFTDAFIADTTHLNAAQTGAYLMLLMCAWRSPDCMIPNDDKILARYARMDGRTWSANKELILSFWNLDGEKWYQARLLDERKFVDDVRNKNSAKGQRSALKRKERDSTAVQPGLNRNSTPTPTPTPTYYKEDKSSLFAESDLPSLPAPTKKAKAKAPSLPKIDFDYEHGDWINTEHHTTIWQKAYPAVDLSHELAQAAAWLTGNPANRKSNHGKFITNWLSRAQDRGGRGRFAQGGAGQINGSIQGQPGQSSGGKLTWTEAGEQAAAYYREQAEREEAEARAAHGEG